MAQSYVVSGALRHGALEDDGQGGQKSVIHLYQDGESFSTEDADLERELRRAKVLLLPEEYAAALASEGNASAMEQLAAERSAKDARLADLERQLAEAQAQLAAAASKSGGAAPKSATTKDPTE